MPSISKSNSTIAAATPLVHDCGGTNRHDIIATTQDVTVEALLQDGSAGGTLGTVAAGDCKSYSFACDKLRLTAAADSSVVEVRSWWASQDED